ncbi:MAG: TonB-dependent receptor [Nitrospirae bacterium]|nr:MAG: TonB-dependent receptor [Nitrospirota bacterium]
MPYGLIRHVLGIVILAAIADLALAVSAPRAEEAKPSGTFTIKGSVQNQDLRRVSQAVVQVKDQEGSVVADVVTNDAGEFSVTVPAAGTYSVHSVLDTYRSEYVVVTVGDAPPSPLVLTLALTEEIALEVVSPITPLQYKSSSTTYAMSRKEIEELPRGNNNDANDVLATIPGAAQDALRQIHIRQEHSNLQFRIDGVPIPDTVTTTFSDIITPRAWERADILLGGLEAQYGNRTAAVIDIMSKSGTKPGFGSVQLFGGSNQTVNPSFEYGGTVGEKFRLYALNSYTTTNRGIQPPTPGHSIFHGQSERNQTYLRGDYQRDNRNNFTWLVLNSVAKYEIPTTPGLAANPATTPVGFTPVASQAVNESQKEDNQYGHMVWRHDLTANQFFSLAGYYRHTRATFETDPLNKLAYARDATEPFSAAKQDRWAYSGGVRLDYTNALNHEHLLKGGFQVDRTQAASKSRVFAFLRDGGGNPDLAAGVIERSGDNRKIAWREEFWAQDQYTPTEQLTFNLGLRYDHIQAYTNSGQVSPRVGVTYKADQANVFHAFYGRLFTPPNIESVAVLSQNLTGTTAQPENGTGSTVRPERSHYVEVGGYHAFSRLATLQVVGYYKFNEDMLDAGQFGTTPMLNYFNFKRGWQRGIDTILKFNFTSNLSGRANVSWGQARAYGLESGQFLLEQATINAINSRGVYADHQQMVTSSALLSYKFRERTTVTGQMLYGSGTRSGEGAAVNTITNPSHTTYNVSLDHVIPLGGSQKFLIGFDVINVLDQTYPYNIGQGIGLGVTHYGMPRSFFFRGQWFF